MKQQIHALALIILKVKWSGLEPEDIDDWDAYLEMGRKMYELGARV